MVVLAGAATSGHAQSGGAETYITPFPSNDVYKIYVLGDSLADGLWAGLYRSYRGNKEIQVVKKSKVSTGLTRSDRYDWNKGVETLVKSEKFDIAVVMFGANDAQPIKIGHKRARFGNEKWRAEYARRVDAFIKSLKKGKKAVYWVGMPILRSKRADKNVQILNTIYREMAVKNGVRYIDIWTKFANDKGRYNAYGPDLSGKIRKLRANDGIHFTMRGYLRLAHYAVREINRDLTAAKAGRKVPLAGSPAEQKSMHAKKDKAKGKKAGADATKSGGVKRKIKSGEKKKSDKDAAFVAPKAYGVATTKVVLHLRGTGGDKTKLSQREIILPRPAIPGAVVAHLERRRRAGRRTVIGRTLRYRSGDGLLVLGTLISSGSRALGRRNVPLTQTPYYKVLIKGEPIRAKTGRADDFSWPSPSKTPAG